MAPQKADSLSLYILSALRAPGLVIPQPVLPIGWRSATEQQTNHIHRWQPVAPPPSTLWMKIFLIEGEEQLNEQGWRKRREGIGDGGGGRKEGRMKQGGDESHLWPRSLRSTFYSGHALLCVCVCVWWYVEVVSLLRANRTHLTAKWSFSANRAGYSGFNKCIAGEK